MQQAQLEAVADVGLLTLSELEIRARQALAAPVWDYVDGGSGSETSLRRNRRALDRLAIEQRILVDVREVDLSTELLGVTLPTPIIVAPVGGLFRIHPGGDPEMARGCGRPGTPFTVSGVAGFPLEEIAQAASAPLIYQIYHHGDHEWAREWLGHVERNGFRLICLTVDTPVYSRRERDIRSRYSARTRREGSIIHPDPLYPARLTWADVRFLRSIINVPFGLKGVLHVDDADHVPRQAADRRLAGHRQADPHLLAQDRQRLTDAGRAADRQSPDGYAADGHGGGAQRDRLDHVVAAAEAAVDDDRHPASDHLGNVLQGVDRGTGVVKLAAAVVGDPQEVAALLDGALGVVDV